MNNPFYLGLSVLNIGKIVIYEFWYHYVKPKYGDTKYGYRQLHYSCKNRGYDEDIDKDFETKIDTSNFELDKALPKGKHKIVIGLVADELGGQIMIEFVALRAKTNSYLKDNNDEDKMVKGTKKSVTKRKLKFQDYKLFRTSSKWN